MRTKYAYSLKELLFRLLRIGRPIRKQLIISTLASIFGSLAHLSLMGFGALFLLRTAGITSSGSAVLYGILTVFSAVIIPLSRYMEGIYSHIGAYGMLARMRVHLFEQIDRISPAFMVDRKKGDILNIAVSDIETLEFFFGHTIGSMFTIILIPLVTLIIAGHYHIRYVLVLLPIFILISVIIPSAALWLGRDMGIRFREDLGELKSLILESVYGIRDIQIFGQGEKRLHTVMRQNEQVNQTAHGLTLHKEAVSAVPDFFVYMARILITAAAAGLIGKELNDPAGAIVVSFVAAASLSSTFSLTFVVTHLLEAFAAAERIFIIEDTPPRVRECDVPENAGAFEKLLFDDVSFTYPGTANSILEHTSFEVRRGDKVGIIGESGAGKSTLFRLLLRFYDPDRGKILFNETDLRQMSFADIHSRITMLEQETYLFDASIADNIAISKPDAQPHEIRKAAERAGIADFIETLPDGYDTPMGLMSARLSGGERQRIGIARIMLLDPDIIVMDEPTSALDVLHEREFLDMLEREYQDKTIIMISHRASTLTNCRRIFELKDRMIREIRK